MGRRPLIIGRCNSDTKTPRFSKKFMENRGVIGSLMIKINVDKRFLHLLRLLHPSHRPNRHHRLRILPIVLDDSHPI